MAKKVLIADDEPNIVTSLQFLMKRKGYEVSIARNGEEALQQVAAVAPDLILLDVMMPLKSGYEVCQKVRKPRVAEDEDHHAQRERARCRGCQGTRAWRRRVRHQALRHTGALAKVRRSSPRNERESQVRGRAGRAVHPLRGRCRRVLLRSLGRARGSRARGSLARANGANPCDGIVALGALATLAAILKALFRLYVSAPRKIAEDTRSSPPRIRAIAQRRPEAPRSATRYRHQQFCRSPSSRSGRGAAADRRGQSEAGGRAEPPCGAHVRAAHR